MLRTNGPATLILTARLLPEPGSVAADVEAAARLRDLSLSQLTNAREMEVDALVDVVHGVRDRTGRLVVVDTLRTRNNGPVALVVRYQGFASHARPHEVLAATAGS